MNDTRFDDHPRKEQYNVSSSAHHAGAGKMKHKLLCCSKKSNLKEPTFEKIAIVGIGMRYPNDIDNSMKFIQLLDEGGDTVRDIPRERWDSDKFYHPDPDTIGKSYVKRGSFLNDLKMFDAQFFGISPSDASGMDPQQRLLLEVTFEAFQDAGISISSTRDKIVGTYISSFLTEHQLYRMSTSGVDYFTAKSSQQGSATMLSNRISHVFNFTGPSITIDTACSGSLVALDLACSSLHNGTSDIAIAGGSNIMLIPTPFISMSKGKLLAKDGHSKSFFENADGYGRGEGISVVLLKTVKRAIEDGDKIYAVIDSTSVNQDGKTQGISQPNGKAQMQNMQNALEKAGIDPLQIGYVEAHGTGTAVGDPTELKAIGAIYGLSTRRNVPLPVGSIKANLNHTEANAGITGVIKAALSVRCGRVFPHKKINGKLNPNIPFDKLNIKIPIHGDPWYVSTRLETAAVNSFGYGGTNGHVILSRYKGRHSRHLPKLRGIVTSKRGMMPITIQFSAASRPSLMKYIQMFASWLDCNKQEVSLPELVYHMNYRLDILPHLLLYRTASLNDLLDQLRRTLNEEGTKVAQSTASANKKIVWVFTGMGPQHWAMGQQLFLKEVVFRQKMEECDKLYMKVSGGKSILTEMMKNEKDSKMSSDQSIAQAANFCLQIALSSLLQSYGITPDAIVGHSVGEVAASVVSSALDLYQGIRLIYYRGHVLDKLVGLGTMIAVGMSENDAMEIIQRFDGVDIAAVNGRKSVVLSGPEAMILSIKNELQSNGVFAKVMHVNVAYHSSQIDGIREEFLSKLKFLKPKNPSIDTYSTVTSNRIVGQKQDGRYWFDNCRQCVKLYSTLKTIISDGYSTFMEIGPHPVLASSIKECALDQHDIYPLYSLRRKDDEITSILYNVARLLQRGHVSHDAFFSGHPPQHGKFFNFPFSYPWDKKELWVEKEELLAELGKNMQLPLLHFSVRNSIRPTWYTSLQSPSLKFLKDHVVEQSIVFPAAAFVEAALEVASTVGSSDVVEIENVSIKEPFLVSGDSAQKMYVEVSSNTVSVSTLHKGSNSVKMTCRINSETRMQSIADGTYDLQHFQNLTEHGIREKYEELSTLGLDYGPSFRCIKSMCISGEYVYSHIQADFRHIAEEDFLIHPAILDSAIQSISLLVKNMKTKALPIGFDRVTLYKRITKHAYCIGEITSQVGDKIIANFVLLDESMEVCCRIESLVCLKTHPRKAKPSLRTDWLYKFVHRASDMSLDDLKPHDYLVLKYFYVNGRSIVFNREEIQGNCQVVVDFRRNQSNELDHYTECRDVAFHLLDFVKKLCSSTKTSSAVKGLTIILRNGLIDESSYPIDLANPSMIMLSGMLRTVAIEVPFHVRVIDCDHSEASFQVLDRLLQSVYHEDEVILREGQIFGNTFARTTSAFPNRERTKNYQDFTTPKYLIESKNTDEKPHFQAFTFDPLEKNEVLIKIDLASFDRKGIENNSIFGQHHRVVGIVGIIDKIGSEVSGGISIGDRVCTLISTTNLQSHVVVPACTCTQFSFWHSDDNISKLKDGVIAWLVLVTMSKLKGGENVLIDIKDSTDMGLYMNAIASDCASNPYIYTRNMKEEPKFHKEVKVVSTEDLCSMPTHFDVLVVDSVKKLTRSHLSSMRPFGRIVVIDNPSKEIDATTIEFARRKFLHILPFDFKSIISVAPEVLKDAIQSIIKMEKKLTMPPRINKFKVHELRGVKSIKHSKSVIADFQKDNALVLTTMEATKSISYAEKDAVIITGGCAGFGLRSALELADWGLKHIVLASRRGIVQDSDKMSVEKLEGKGVNVMAFSLDVTKRGDLSNALDKLKKEGLSVCGILHSATIYADKFIAELSKDHFMLSYETKAKGAWNLHVETLKLKLKFFICYSSVVVSVGNQGQSAYAASNAFLDGLIAFRVAQGLEGTSIRWGKIGEVGLMARNKYVDNLQERMGVLAVTPKEGLTLMKEIILRGHYQITIHNCTWQKIRKTSTVLDSVTQQKTGPFIARWEAVNSLMVLDKLQRLKSIEGRLVDSIERITGYTSLTGNTALETLGIDSLAATEIQFAIDESISVNIKVMEIFDSVDIAHLSTKVYKIVEESHIEMKNTMNGLSSLGSSKVFKQVEENYTEVKETIDYHM